VVIHKSFLRVHQEFEIHDRSLVILGGLVTCSASDYAYNYTFFVWLSSVAFVYPFSTVR